MCGGLEMVFPYSFVIINVVIMLDSSDLDFEWILEENF